eukprot:4567067-Alexandrium_andersonii.AAC.1
MGLSAYCHIHFLLVALRREVARRGRLPGLRFAASRVRRVELVQHELQVRDGPADGRLSLIHI